MKQKASGRSNNGCELEGNGRSTSHAPAQGGGEASPVGGVTTQPRFLPRWASLFLGRWIQRLCLAKHDCQNTHCQLRPLCQCAKEDLETARKVETRVWLVVGGCGLAVLAWALIW